MTFSLNTYDVVTYVTQQFVSITPYMCDIVDYPHMYKYKLLIINYQLLLITYILSIVIINYC